MELPPPDGNVAAARPNLRTNAFSPWATAPCPFGRHRPGPDQAFFDIRRGSSEAARLFAKVRINAVFEPPDAALSRAFDRPYRPENQSGKQLVRLPAKRKTTAFTPLNSTIRRKFFPKPAESRPELR
jgi:hypothetical protein